MTFQTCKHLTFCFAACPESQRSDSCTDFGSRCVPIVEQCMDEVQDDVTAASMYVEGEVRRLLAGGCEAWEMVMTVCNMLPV